MTALLEKRCYGRKEFFDDTSTQCCCAVIEACNKIYEIFFAFLGLTSFGTVSDGREDIWFCLNGSSSCVTGVTVAIRCQTAIFFELLLERSQPENLVNQPANERKTNVSLNALHLFPKIFSEYLLDVFRRN